MLKNIISVLMLAAVIAGAATPVKERYVTVDTNGSLIVPTNLATANSLVTQPQLLALSNSLASAARARDLTVTNSMSVYSGTDTNAYSQTLLITNNTAYVSNLFVNGELPALSNWVYTYVLSVQTSSSNGVPMEVVNLVSNFLETTKQPATFNLTNWSSLSTGILGNYALTGALASATNALGSIAWSNAALFASTGSVIRASNYLSATKMPSNDVLRGWSTLVTNLVFASKYRSTFGSDGFATPLNYSPERFPPGTLCFYTNGLGDSLFSPVSDDYGWFVVPENGPSEVVIQGTPDASMSTDIYVFQFAPGGYVYTNLARLRSDILSSNYVTAQHVLNTSNGIMAIVPMTNQVFGTNAVAAGATYSGGGDYYTPVIGVGQLAYATYGNATSMRNETVLDLVTNWFVGSGHAILIQGPGGGAVTAKVMVYPYMPGGSNMQHMLMLAGYNTNYALTIGGNATNYANATFLPLTGGLLSGDLAVSNGMLSFTGATAGLRLPPTAGSLSPSTYGGTNYAEGIVYDVSGAMRVTNTPGLYYVLFGANDSIVSGSFGNIGGSGFVTSDGSDIIFNGDSGSLGTPVGSVYAATVGTYYHGAAWLTNDAASVYGESVAVSIVNGTTNGILRLVSRADSLIDLSNAVASFTGGHNFDANFATNGANKIALAANLSLTNVTVIGTLDVSEISAGSLSLTNPISVDVGGTGRTNLQTGTLLLGNGTNAVNFAIPFYSLYFTNGTNLSLVGDAAAPGNSKYYGTDISGNKGFFTLPAGGGGGGGTPLYTNSVLITASNLNFIGFPMTNDGQYLHVGVPSATYDYTGLSNNIKADIATSNFVNQTKLDQTNMLILAKLTNYADSVAANASNSAISHIISSNYVAQSKLDATNLLILGAITNATNGFSSGNNYDTDYFYTNGSSKVSLLTNLYLPFATIGTATITNSIFLDPVFTNLTVYGPITSTNLDAKLAAASNSAMAAAWADLINTLDSTNLLLLTKITNYADSVAGAASNSAISSMNYSLALLSTNTYTTNLYVSNLVASVASIMTLNIDAATITNFNAISATFSNVTVTNFNVVTQTVDVLVVSNLQALSVGITNNTGTNVIGKTLFTDWISLTNSGVTNVIAGGTTVSNLAIDGIITSTNLAARLGDTNRLILNTATNLAKLNVSTNGTLASAGPTNVTITFLNASTTVPASLKVINTATGAVTYALSGTMPVVLYKTNANYNLTIVSATSTNVIVGDAVWVDVQTDGATWYLRY